jgi:hypothetical protein
MQLSNQKSITLPHNAQTQNPSSLHHSNTEVRNYCMYMEGLNHSKLDTFLGSSLLNSTVQDSTGVVIYIQTSHDKTADNKHAVAFS